MAEFGVSREDRHLRRSLGFWQLTAIGFSGVIGSGWLLGAMYAAQLAGPEAIVAWLVGGAVLMLIALVMADLGVAIMAVFVVLNWFGALLFARVNVALTVAKFIVPALTVVALFVAGFHRGNFTSHRAPRARAGRPGSRRRAGRVQLEPSRPCQVVMHASLPSGSASTQKAGASAS